MKYRCLMMQRKWSLGQGTRASPNRHSGVCRRRYLSAASGNLRTERAQMAVDVALVLASGSPRRRELMSLLQVPFEVRVPEVDERALPHEVPAAVPQVAFKMQLVDAQTDRQFGTISIPFAVEKK